MRVFTQRLGQFAISALIFTVAFRYALDLSVGMKSFPAALVCSIVYFGLMFFAGWYYGSKDAVDELTNRLKNDGYEVISGPRMTGDGYYESCIIGIEGNQIEITV